MGRLDCSDASIKDAINDVKEDGTEADFCVCKYVPKSDKLKVQTKAAGELEDMMDELNDGQVQYIYMRFKVGDMQGYKFVFIAWCGEGVSGMMRGNFANHATDFENFLDKNMLRPHVRINARSENDLDEADIVKKINSAKGANFVQAATRKQGLGPSVKDEGDKYWKQQKVKDKEHAEAVFSHAQAKQQEYDNLRAAEEEKQKQLGEQRLAEMEQMRQADVAQMTASEKARAEEFDRRRKQQVDQTLGAIEREKEAAIQARSVGAHKDERADMPDHNKYEAPAPAPSARAPEGWEAAKTGADRVAASSMAAARQSFGEQPEPEGRYQYDEPEPEPEPAQPEASAYEPEPEAYEEPAPAAAGGSGGDDPPGTLYRVQAIYEYEVAADGDLALAEGDIVCVTDDSDPDGWLVGVNLSSGLSGACPGNFVERI